MRSSHGLSLALLLSLAGAAAADRPPPPVKPPPDDAGEPIGLVAVRGEPVRKSEDALSAWDGSAWSKTLVSACPSGQASCYGKEGKEVCLSLGPSKPAAAVDLDGDGTEDVLVDLECTSADDTMCGTLALTRNGECLHASGILRGPKVSVHKAGRPPELLVSTASEDSRTWAEYVTIWKDGGWQVTLTRDCEKGRGCGKMYPNRKRKGDMK